MTTAAQNRAISESDRWRELSLSAKSNMESSRKRALDAELSDSRRKTRPLRQIIELLAESNMQARRTRSTSNTPACCRTMTLVIGHVRLRLGVVTAATYLKKCHLIIGAEQGKARDALCELHHPADSGRKAFTEIFKNSFCTRFGRVLWLRIKRACLLQ